MKRETLARIISHTFAIVIVGLIIWGLYVIFPNEEELDTSHIGNIPNYSYWYWY